MSEQSPVYHPSATPDVQAILTSPSTSVWLKDALQAALQCDPVEAANDAELLASLLTQRRAALQAKGSAIAGSR